MVSFRKMPVLLLGLLFVFGAFSIQPLAANWGFEGFKRDYDRVGIMKMSYPAMLRFCLQEEYRFISNAQRVLQGFPGDAFLADYLDQGQRRVRDLRPIFSYYDTEFFENPLTTEPVAAVAFHDLLQSMALAEQNRAFMVQAMLKHPIMARYEHSRFRIYLNRVNTNSVSAPEALQELLAKLAAKQLETLEASTNEDLVEDLIKGQEFTTGALNTGNFGSAIVTLVQGAE
jgi:hypothetical protein